MGVIIETDGLVAILRMECGRGNAINGAFIRALGDALAEAERGAAAAVVLTGQGRAFSAGLDLLEAYELDREGTRGFVEAFDRLFLAVLKHPKPLVAAINGHAIAGGCILAMACDLRVMAEGPYLIGVNEVELGIPFPSAAFEIARRALPPPAWTEGMLEGKRWTPAEAHAVGLVHHLAPDGGALTAAVARARALAERPAAALRQVKADLVAGVVASIEAGWDARRDRFVEHWMGPEARRRIGAVREALLRKAPR